MKIKVIAFIVSFTLVVCAVGCYDSEDKIREDQKKIIINLAYDPPELNSILSMDSVSFNIINHVFEGLTRLGKNQNIIPGIAKKIDISEDRLTYTFYIRNSKWSDGSKISAKDFEFAFKEVLNPKNLSEYASIMYMIKNAKQYNLGKAQREDVGVVAKGDNILEVTLEKPCSYFLYLTATSPFMPIKKKFYERQEGQYAKTEKNMIFNGAWVIDTWIHGKKIVLKKNLNYWNNANIKLNEIELLMIKDEEILYNMFKQNKIDMIDVRGEYIKRAKDAGYQVKNYLNGATEYLEFNMNSDVLKNRNIRKAITYVIDRNELCNTVLKNECIEANTFTNPVVLNGNDITVKKSNLNKKQRIKKAKELFNRGLKELGNIGDINLKLLTNDSENSIKRAKYYAENIEKNLGIKISLEKVTFKEKLIKHKNCDFDIEVVCISPDYNSPITYLDMLGENNSLIYINNEYNKILENAKQELSNKKRMEMFKKMENIIIDDVPIYPLCYRNVHYIVKNNLKDMVRCAFEEFNMYNAGY